MNRGLLVLTILITFVVLPIFVYLCFKISRNVVLNDIRDFRSIIDLQIKAFTSSERHVSCPIYYINLERSPQRKDFMEKQAKSLNLNLTRIPAIDGKLIQQKQINNLYTGSIDAVEYTNDFSDISFSELSCTMSHIKAIRTAFDNGDKYACICEDDASFSLLPLWPKNLIETLITNMSQNTGIIQLYWNAMGVTKPMCKYQKHYSNNDLNGAICWGAVAYIITKKGMTDILSHSNYLSGSHIHLRKNAHVKFGYADGYLFQCTSTSTSGFPLITPDNEDLLMRTTQHDRPFFVGSDFGSIRLQRKILKQHVHGSSVRRLEYKKQKRDVKDREMTYRLGDAYLGAYRPIWTRAYHRKWYHNTLIGQYFQKTNKFKQFDILLQVIMENKPNLVADIPKNAIVIHLRLGDVIERCKYSVDEHLSKELPYSEHPAKWIWVHSKGYYDKKLRSFPSLLEKIRLVFGKHRAGPTFGDSLSKTKEYVQKLQKHFEQQGYNVEIHDSNGDPDQDFLYLCFAPHLIAGGGSGYANLAKKINDHIYKK